MATATTNGNIGKITQVIGSTFDGRVVSETTVGDRPAIVPAVRGSAWITGITQVLVDPGTYCYHEDAAWRDYFRSTRAHSARATAGSGT